MYIFLSSGERERYRNDVLRNLSAPLGAEVTFRYRTKHVETSLLDRLTSSDQAQGLVCHANVEDEGPATLIPIRFVTVSRTFVPGSTLVLELRTEEFTKPNSSPFEGSEMDFPRRKDGEVKGSFVLETDELSGISRTKRIDKWENIASKISSDSSINEEFFFVVIGMYAGKPKSIKEISRWPNSIYVNKNYDIYVYTYSDKDSIKNDEVYKRLSLSSDIEVKSNIPRDIIINSSRDIKKWGIRVPNQNMLGTGYEWIGTRKSWIQVGPHNDEESKAKNGGNLFEWQIGLDLNHGRSSPVFFFALILLGIIFAVPVFYSNWDPAEMSDVESRINWVSSILFGLASALILLALPIFPSLTDWVRDNP